MFSLKTPPAPVQDDRFVPWKELAAKLGFTAYSTLYRAIAAGHLPPVEKPYPGSKRVGWFRSTLARHGVRGFEQEAA